MPKRRCTLRVPVEEGAYSFDVLVDTKYLKEWQDAGIDIHELENAIPVWVVDVGLLKPWCFFQDLFNFKNPFKR